MSDKVSKQGSTPSPWAWGLWTKSKKGRSRHQKSFAHRVYSARRGLRPWSHDLKSLRTSGDSNRCVMEPRVQRGFSVKCSTAQDLGSWSAPRKQIHAQIHAQIRAKIRAKICAKNLCKKSVQKIRAEIRAENPCKNKSIQMVLS